MSYNERLDFLTALVPGAVVDEPYDQELMTAFAWSDDEAGDRCERAWLLHRKSGGPLIGFGVRGAFAWDLAGEDPDAAVWATPRFDVPSLALRNATVGEIVLAAQHTITGPTPDVVEFDLAVQAGMRGDRELAEHHWRACLACDEMTAHYGLGYTLIELGRPREAFGHLAMYTEICPRNAWAWAYRGRAAHHMGETAEARLAYQAARGYEAAGSTETNAASWLAELEAETADNPGTTVTTILPRPPATVTARFAEALEYARAHHADQRRKGTTIPYLAHLLAVSAIVLEHGGSETAAIAALLHDVVEDGGGDRALADIGQRFGPEVAAIVAGCSDSTTEEKEDWTLRKHRYLAHLEVAEPDVLLVSGADKLHNARSILSDLREDGDKLWERFKRGAREQLWYYGALRDVFLRRLPGRLADELDRAVCAIERRIDAEDRVAWLGLPCDFWSIELGESGAFIDWPGCPLIVEHTEAGPHGPRPCRQWRLVRRGDRARERDRRRARRPAPRIQRVARARVADRRRSRQPPRRLPARGGAGAAGDRAAARSRPARPTRDELPGALGGGTVVTGEVRDRPIIAL